MLRSRYTRVRPTPAEPVLVQLMGPRFLEPLRARDISRSGVGVWTARPIAECSVDAHVRLVLRIPGGRPVIALGEVRHRTEHLDNEFFGIEFMELAVQHRAQIEAYIERRLREERATRPCGKVGSPSASWLGQLTG